MMITAELTHVNRNIVCQFIEKCVQYSWEEHHHATITQKHTTNTTKDFIGRGRQLPELNSVEFS